MKRIKYERKPIFESFDGFLPFIKTFTDFIRKGKFQIE